MSVLNEIAQICEKKYLTTMRAPVLARIPKSKYIELLEYLRDKVRVQLVDETSDKLSLYLTTGKLFVVPYNGSTIEVEFEKEN